MASALPCTSALIRTATSFCSPAAMRASIWSSVPRAAVATPAALSRSLRWRNSLISRARPSFSTTTNGSPAIGTPARPRISTGVDGPADLHLLALVVEHGAHAAPFGAGHDDVALVQRAASAPARSPPARGRDPAGFRSPSLRPARSGLARRSRISACSRIASCSLSRPVFLSGGDLHILRLAAHFLDHDLVAAAVPGARGSGWRPVCPSC